MGSDQDGSESYEDLPEYMRVFAAENDEELEQFAPNQHGKERIVNYLKAKGIIIDSPQA